MIKKLFLAFFLIGINPGFAQPRLMLVAFSQVYTGGKSPQVEETVTGKPVLQPSGSISNFFIYISMDSSVSVHPVLVWVANKWYSVRLVIAEKTPVYLQAPSKKLLVAATKKRVVRVLPGDTLTVQQKPTPDLSLLMKQAKLIVAYQWKDKVYYIGTKKITELPPLIGM